MKRDGNVWVLVSSTLSFKTFIYQLSKVKILENGAAFNIKKKKTWHIYKETVYRGNLVATIENLCSLYNMNNNSQRETKALGWNWYLAF